jgi:hypothetical protein
VPQNQVKIWNAVFAEHNEENSAQAWLGENDDAVLSADKIKKPASENALEFGKAAGKRQH